MVTKRNRNKNGQALVEFCIGLVALLTVFVGIILLGKLGLARTEARVEATRRANQAIDLGPNTVVQLPNYVRGIDAGIDNRPYSQDDVSLSGNPLNTLLTLAQPNHQIELRSHAPGNQLAELGSSNDFMSSSGLVGRSVNQRVPIENHPIIRRLFFNQNMVNLTVTVWSVRTGDLY